MFGKVVTAKDAEILGVPIGTLSADAQAATRASYGGGGGIIQEEEIQIHSTLTVWILILNEQ